MPRVTELFAFVTSDQDEDDEGVIGFQSEDPETGDKVWIQMIGANMDRVASLRPIADTISKQRGKPYTVLHFALVGEIKPTGNPLPIPGVRFQISGKEQFGSHKKGERL